MKIVVSSAMIHVVAITGAAKVLEDDAWLKQILASLKLQPSATPLPQPGTPNTTPTQRPAGPQGWNKMSGELGVFGVGLLVVCYAVSRQSEQKPRRKKSSVKKKARE